MSGALRQKPVPKKLQRSAKTTTATSVSTVIDQQIA
jgi:hypothetical protein